MIRLTVEEMNLLSIYHEGSKAQLMDCLLYTSEKSVALFFYPKGGTYI